MQDAEVLRRSNLSQKRKTRNAIDVINMMVEAGEIDKLWRDFHINLKSARSATVCKFAGSLDVRLYLTLVLSLSWDEEIRGCFLDDG